MKALTVWPEWAVAFILLNKRIENRPWPCPGGIIGQRIALHAGARIGGKIAPTTTGVGWTLGQRKRVLDAYGKVWNMAASVGFGLCFNGTRLGHKSIQILGRGRYERQSLSATYHYTDIPTSSVFAVATIAKCEFNQSAAYRPWAVPGQYGFVLADFTLLTAPVFAKGHQRFWDLGPNTEQLVQEQLLRWGGHCPDTRSPKPPVVGSYSPEEFHRWSPEIPEMLPDNPAQAFDYLDRLNRGYGGTRKELEEFRREIQAVLSLEEECEKKGQA